MKGSLLGADAEEEKRGVADTIQSLVAYSSYLVLSGEGEGILGDGKCSAVQGRAGQCSASQCAHEISSLLTVQFLDFVFFLCPQE